MWTKKNALSNKKLNIQKLLDYGFTQENDTFTFSKPLGDLTLTAIISNSHDLSIKVIDNEINDEYILAYVEDSTGEFVGLVKYECERLFDDVAEKCFDENVFKFRQTKELLQYVKQKYDVTEEYMWKDTPNNAIIRVKNSKKWFCAILTLEYRKLGIDKDGLCEIIDLKQTTENIEKMVDNKNFFHGFHMNKKHWYTIVLDGRLPTEKIFECVDNSYNLIKK